MVPRPLLRHGAGGATGKAKGCTTGSGNDGGGNGCDGRTIWASGESVTVAAGSVAA